MKKQPNLLFIFADQWRRQAVGFVNEDQVQTPTLDALAKESVIFDNAISSCPLCSPFRASLFTGKYPLSNGVFTNCKTGLDIMLKEEETCLSDILHDNGYHTAYIGKWHLDIPERHYNPNPISGAKGWDAYTPPGPKRHQFDFWHSYGADDNHFTPHYWTTTHEPIKVNEWSITHETNVAIDYINTHKDEPFAMFLSYNPPHSPYDLVPDEYFNLYKDMEINFRPNTKFDHIGYHTHEPSSYGKEELTLMTKQYYAAVTGLDAHIGKLLDCLKTNQIADDTLIIISSDHGDMMGSHGLMAKHVWYEESIGVPFILHWKNGALQTGHVSTVVDTTDIMPTLLHLMNLECPDTVEGIDVASEFLSSETSTIDPNKPGFLCCFPGRDVFQAAFEECDKNQLDFGWRGIRTPDYTFVIHLGYYPDCTMPVKYLYDLKNDPYQLNPIPYDSVLHQPIIQDLETQLLAWLASQNDGFLKILNL